MTQDTKQQETAKSGASRFHEEFNALPLDEKLSNLFQLEVATLSEAMKYVADSSMKVIERVGDAISEFGSRVESEASKATAANADSGEEPQPVSEPKQKEAPKKKPTAPKVGN